MTTVSNEPIVMTTASNDDTEGEVLGFVACAVAVVLFGSNLVPVKKFETGDGFFFQWIQCSAIMFMSVVVQLVQNCPQFHPLVMVGGLLWATGNVMTVPIIQLIGMGQGMLVWGSVNLLLGWASGRFGWFRIDPQVPNNVPLNYAGMALCLVSAVVYLFLRTGTNTSSSTSDDRQPMLVNQSDEFSDNPVGGRADSDILPPAVRSPSSNEFLGFLSPLVRRILGIAMSLLAGCFYGLQFVPVMYVQDNYPGASQNGLDYVFSMFTGIYMGSTAHFLIYCAAKRNRPRIYPKAILPGFISGVMWAIASSAWLVANAKLSAPISFPIITTAPGVIGTLWAVFFREIQGKRNFLILALAFTVSITGSILTGLSKRPPS